MKAKEHSWCPAGTSWRIKTREEQECVSHRSRGALRGFCPTVLLKKQLGVELSGLGKCGMARKPTAPPLPTTTHPIKISL